MYLLAAPADTRVSAAEDKPSLEQTSTQSLAAYADGFSEVVKSSHARRAPGSSASQAKRLKRQRC